MVDGVTPGSASEFNSRFGAIASVLNGNIDQDNIKDASIPIGKLAGNVLTGIFPVGSIYMNGANAGNPAVLLGFGTWEAFGAGRVPVGFDGTQTEFNAVAKTGGDKNLQSHNHTGTTSTNGDHTHTTNKDPVVTSGSGNSRLNSGSGQQTAWAQPGIINSAGNHSHSFTTDNAGSGDSQNLQPYIVVYMWIRTA